MSSSSKLPGSDQPPKDVGYLDRLWKWGHHEDVLFDSRFEKFSIVHALLLSCVAFTLQREKDDSTFLYVVAVLGAVLGVIWLLVQIRSRRLLASLESEISELDPLYRKHISRGGVSQAKLMCIVPGVVVALWLLFALALYNRWVS